MVSFMLALFSKECWVLKTLWICRYLALQAVFRWPNRQGSHSTGCVQGGNIADLGCSVVRSLHCLVMVIVWLHTTKCQAVMVVLGGYWGFVGNKKMWWVCRT